MDVYAWLLLGGSVSAASAVLIGLIGVIRQQNADFEDLLAKNEELDQLLNCELAANQQLMLEREFELAIKEDEANHGASSAKLPVFVLLHPDEIDITPMPHWLDDLPPRSVIKVN